MKLSMTLSHVIFLKVYMSSFCQNKCDDDIYKNYFLNNIYISSPCARCMFYPRFGCVFVYGFREHMNFEECLDYFYFLN